MANPPPFDNFNNFIDNNNPVDDLANHDLFRELEAEEQGWWQALFNDPPEPAAVDGGDMEGVQEHPNEVQAAAQPDVNTNTMVYTIERQMEVLRLHYSALEGQLRIMWHERNNIANERDMLKQERDMLKQERDALKQERDALQRQLDETNGVGEGRKRRRV